MTARSVGRTRQSLKPLSDQVLVITGATSGIGLSTARAAVKAGAAVFLISRNEVVLRALCAELTAGGGRADFAVADVGDASALAAASQRAVARFGGYDTWVNAAGVAIAAPLLETPVNEHERLFRTNYWGAVNACAVAVEHLKPKGGALIIVGSIASDIGAPVLGAYSASKHAVKGFVDSLRIELIAAKSPISLTLIKPSGVGTPLGDHTADHMDGAVKIPPPAYPPETVAKAILYAAEHPRREMVIGGVGALQIFGATVTPRLADQISSFIGPLLVDKTRPPTTRNNLFAAGVDGAERSRRQFILPGSLFTAADTHRRLTALIICGAAVLGLGALIAFRPRNASPLRLAIAQRLNPGTRF